MTNSRLTWRRPEKPVALGGVLPTSGLRASSPQKGKKEEKLQKNENIPAQDKR